MIDLTSYENGQFNFKIQIEKNVYYYPIMLATVVGKPDILEYILKDQFIDINVKDT